MEDDAKVEMYVNQGCLVVPIQVELNDDLVLKVQKDILIQVNTAGLKGVVIDLSGVSIIDLYLATTLFDTAKMTTFLGAVTVITGLRPGVVASLINLGFDPQGVLTAVTLDKGLQIIAQLDEGEDEEIEDETGTEDGVEEAEKIHDKEHGEK